MSLTEDRYTPPSVWCPEPGRWHSDDGQATEHEVSALVAAFVTALRPAVAIETGTNSGQTAAAIGAAMAAAGHGHLFTFEIDPRMVEASRARCRGLPVTVLNHDALAYLQHAAADPAAAQSLGPVGFAWLDSHIGARVSELLALQPLLADGAVVGLHDTGPQHPVAGELAARAGARFTALALRTPRGVTFGQFTGKADT